MIAVLDSFRQRMLKVSLGVPLLRKIYVSRALRLSTLMLASLCASIFLAHLSVVWMILLSPLILGVPHLLSSFKTVDRICVSSLRFSPSLAISILIFGVLFFAPLRTAVELGTFALLHNFVGFYYWYRAAKTPSEKTVSILGFILLVTVSALIFNGALDSLAANGTLLNRWSPGPFAEDFGRMLWTKSSDPLVWSRITLIYAIGQSVHYFVWLKAIPDTRAPNSRGAVSFRAFWETQMNPAHRLTFITGAVLFLFFWALLLFYDLETVRNLYLMLAAFHGFYEIYGVLRHGLRSS